MNVNRNLSAFLGAVGTALLVTSSPAMAENDISPSSEPRVPSNWELRKNEKTDAIELTTRVASGALSTMCAEGACGVFVEPVSGCVPGAKYPLLINSAKQVGVVPSQCAIIPGDSDGKVRYVVLLQDQKSMIKAMMEEIDITIAFPTQAGQMDVLALSMAGVREALSEIMPELTDSDANESAGARPTKTFAAPEKYRL